jgi:hypothetical protein
MEFVALPTVRVLSCCDRHQLIKHSKPYVYTVQKLIAASSLSTAASSATSGSTAIDRSAARVVPSRNEPSPLIDV